MPTTVPKTFPKEPKTAVSFLPVAGPIRCYGGHNPVPATRPAELKIPWASARVGSIPTPGIDLQRFHDVGILTQLLRIGLPA